MKGGLLSAWLAEVVLVTYRVFHNGAKDLPLPMPLPSTYTSTMVIYGALGLAPESWNQATTLFGWGLVVATLLNIWTPGKSNTNTNTGGSTASSNGSSTAPSNGSSGGTSGVTLVSTVVGKTPPAQNLSITSRQGG